MSRTRSTLTAAGCIAGAGIAGVLFGINPANGASTPLCGGNNHQWQAPVTCTNSRVIDGTKFTVVVNETAGGSLSVTFTFPARAVPTQLTIKSHVGKSGSNQGVTDPIVTVPPGGTTATLTIARANCGQVDVHAVFVGPGAANGRVSGPFINNDTCKETPTTDSLPATSIVQTSTSSPTSSPTSHPRSGSSSSTTATPVVPPTTGVGGTLPPTGAPTWPAAVGAATVLGGLGLVRLTTRRRAASR